MSAASAAVLTNLTLGLDLAGVAANALLGAVKARERHLDLFGVAVVAIASGPRGRHDPGRPAAAGGPASGGPVPGAGTDAFPMLPFLLTPARPLTPPEPRRPGGSAAA